MVRQCPGSVGGAGCQFWGGMGAKKNASDRPAVDASLVSRFEPDVQSGFGSRDCSQSRCVASLCRRLLDSVVDFDGFHDLGVSFDGDHGGPLSQAVACLGRDR